MAPMPLDISSLATGALVRLAATNGAMTSDPLRVQRLPNGGAIFRTSEGGSLRICANGAVDTAGRVGPWAQFFLDADAADPTTFCLRSVGHAQKNRIVFLEATQDALQATTQEKKSSGTRFHLVSADDQCSSTGRPSYTLNAEQKASFMRDGFLILRNAVPRDLVEDALRTVNRSLAPPQEGMPTAVPAVPELLVRSPALAAAEQLLGARVRVKNPTGQVALRFPMAPAEAKQRRAKGDDEWHIDSMNKLAHMSEFQLLVGVALSAQPDDDCGNLHVWPGEHTTVHDAVRRARQHPEALPASYSVADNGNFWCGERPHVPAARRTQLRLNPGDVILKHQRMPHSVGLNRSPHIRYQVYFRLSADDFSPAEAPLRGLFDGWHGLKPEGEAAVGLA